MDVRETLLAQLSQRRFRVGQAIAACLLGWWTLFVFAELLTAPEGLEHEILSFCGDLFGLAAAVLALTTPWTAAQRAQAADRRLLRMADLKRGREGENL